MLRPLLLVSLVVLPACDLFAKGSDLFEGLTNPLVGLGIVLAVEESAEYDLSESGFDPGTAATVFLADAASVDDLENAPVDGADVSLGGVDAAGQGSGAYLIDPTQGLVWVDGATWTLSAAIGRDVATVRFTLPDAADANIPTTGTPGQAVTVDLGDAAYDGVLVIAIDTTSGDVVFSNEPTDIRGIYEFTRGGDVEPVEIPGSALSEETLYLIGVAGTTKADAAGIDGMNTLLSTVMAGKMVFHPYYTGPSGA